MLSVVIATQDCERKLLATLTALVGGAAGGLVREVIIADAGSRDATLAIADDAGCRLITAAAGRGAGLRAGAEAARAAWLLFLQPGIVPDAGWVDEASRFMEHSEITAAAPRAASFRSASAPSRPLVAELLDLVRAGLGARPHAKRALLIGSSLYQQLDGHRPVDEPEADLVRRLGRRRIALLRTGVTLDT
jgi:glycosyltransferase involved in cell wall biosynthesis